MRRKLWIYFVLVLVGTQVSALAQDGTATPGLLDSLSEGFTWLVNNVVFGVLLFDAGTGFPFIVLWLITGAVFFTIRMKFINIRAFKHAVDVVRGKYDDPEDEGEVSHFQALATALSATVGLGNIAGVAIAVSVGGPGAVVWMTVGGLFGMTSKFVECTLGQKYRVVNPDGTISGGPMRYLSRGLAEMGQGTLGRVLAIVFSVFCIFGAFGGANMFQANQSYGAVSRILPFLPPWLYGLILAGLVGLVIIGGVERIGQVAGAVVPAMCGLYVVAALFILLVNITAIPGAIATIVTEAFNPQAVQGGIVGVIAQGLRRSAFSNEAGIGSAAIAHSAAKTEEPVREGIVALLEPFIDTVLVCNMTALVIVITGAYNDPAFEDLRQQGAGAELTSAAFGSAIPWFPAILAIAVFLFAFSTMISWGYYGERCWDYLTGGRVMIVYKVLFLFATFLGSIAAPGPVIDFSDGMLLAMAFPNLIGAYFLSGKVWRDLKDYMNRLDSGEMRTYTPGQS
ncbi:alanine:cation symporter family protein [Spirulina subsalsa FACHB-351]|uniref:Alanine:cation symporter family protein n=1 Tax=Spirulina subsalsa FACHB-351 TaxID=234711 RepID=A0ABT3L7M3_9CYAN|nr:alanine/glycine:cation symporter family protein [Spirulina subsalsa]MCW6037089.1 alanine:cation symporter family protein [Spirulina subsalsa FACHB-351]